MKLKVNHKKANRDTSENNGKKNVDLDKILKYVEQLEKRVDKLENKK